MHTFNFQAIVTPDDILSSLMGLFVSKHSDWGMVQDKYLEEYLKKLNRG